MRNKKKMNFRTAGTYTLDRPQTGVHLDLVNLIHSPRTLYAHRALFEEAVRQLKPDVLSVHVKDIRLDCKPVNTKLDEVELGHGEVDIGHMLSLLAQLDGDVPLMLEHLKSTRAYERAAAYLRRTAREANIQIQ